MISKNKPVTHPALATSCCQQEMNKELGGVNKIVLKRHRDHKRSC